jgi:hypothetical protein
MKINLNPANRTLSERQEATKAELTKLNIEPIPALVRRPGIDKLIRRIMIKNLALAWIKLQQKQKWSGTRIEVGYEQ